MINHRLWQSNSSTHIILPKDWTKFSFAIDDRLDWYDLERNLCAQLVGRTRKISGTPEQTSDVRIELISAHVQRAIPSPTPEAASHDNLFYKMTLVLRL
jgi:hypothetical protein